MAESDKEWPVPLSRVFPTPARSALQSMGEVEQDLEDRLEKAEEARDKNAPRWQMRQTKRKLRMLLEEPTSSTAAYAIAIFIFSMIIMSTVAFVIDTLPSIQTPTNASLRRVKRVMGAMDWVFIIIFSTEYLLRLVVACNQLDFVLDVRNLVDLIAILPFYLEQFSEQMGSFDLRFLRLARVLRVFKLSRYGNKLTLVLNALLESRDIMGMLGVNLIILVVLFSSLTYYAEKSAPDPDCVSTRNGECESLFLSIPHTFWWCVVTVLTVGYGDMYPSTLPGKILATVLMCLSLVVLALPISIIGTSFSNQWLAYKEEQWLTEITKTLTEAAASVYTPLRRWLIELRATRAIVKRSSKDLNASMKKLHDLMAVQDWQELHAQMQHCIALAQDVAKVLCSEHIDGPQLHHLLSAVLHERTMLQQEKDAFSSVMIAAEKVVQKATSALLQSRADVPVSELCLKDFQGFAHVHIIGARGLAPGKRWWGARAACNSFVELEVAGRRTHSKPVTDSLSPFWDEHMVLLLKDLTAPVQLRVWDDSKLSAANLVGQAQIRLEDLQPGVLTTLWVDLYSGREQGSVRLSVMLHRQQDITAQVLEQQRLFSPLTEQLLGKSPPEQYWRSATCYGTTSSCKTALPPQPGPSMDVPSCDSPKSMRPPVPAPQTSFQLRAGMSLEINSKLQESGAKVLGKCTTMRGHSSRTSNRPSPRGERRELDAA